MLFMFTKSVFFDMSALESRDHLHRAGEKEGSACLENLNHLEDIDKTIVILLVQ
jgi:hypothetical protein